MRSLGVLRQPRDDSLFLRDSCGSLSLRSDSSFVDRTRIFILALVRFNKIFSGGRFLLRCLFVLSSCGRFFFCHCGRRFRPE